jgi:hypothetical protein
MGLRSSREYRRFTSAAIRVGVNAPPSDISPTARATRRLESWGFKGTGGSSGGGAGTPERAAISAAAEADALKAFGHRLILRRMVGPLLAMEGLLHRMLRLPLAMEPHLLLQARKPPGPRKAVSSSRYLLWIAALCREEAESVA